MPIKDRRAFLASSSVTGSGIAALGVFTGAGLAAASKVASNGPHGPREGEIMEFETKVLPSAADAIAPDGSEVRLLTGLTRGGMAHFALGPREVSKPVAHKTIEEIWYFTGGRGRMWRRLGDRKEVVDVFPGVSITIPTGTHFQFRSDTDEWLEAVGVSMPPWPGPDEAYEVEGEWQPTV